MKKVIYLVTLLINVFCYSQIKNGTIVYGKLNAEIDLKTIPIDFREKIEKSNKDSDKIDYTLNFVGNESYFFANPLLLEDNTLFANYVGIGGGKLKYYQNIETKEYREYRDNKRTGKTITNKKELYEWTLHKETKIIDGYTCYKATTPQITNESTKTNDIKFNYTAWYTPQIPISLGPVGYGNLPGLILELQKPSVTYYVKKINLNLETAPKIDKLLDIKAISQETYLEMIMGTFNNEQLKAIEDSKK